MRKIDTFTQFKKTLLCSALLAPYIAVAQSNTTARLEEVVVTATKRAQSLSDVGLTISALGSEDLKLRRVSDGQSLALEIPGLNFTPSPNATPVYTLRGVGFFESSIAAYPDVSLYIDQVPLPFPMMASHTAFDLERVEVLKGPQGTLFGNNATGGAINFIAAKPTDEFEGGFDLSYGRFSTIEAGGYVSGPIAETLKARLAVKSVTSDEWQSSYDIPGEELGELDHQTARLIIDWAPTNDLAMSFNINGWQDQSDPLAPQKIAVSPQYPVGTAGGFGAVTQETPIISYPNLNPGSGRDAGWTPGVSFSDHKFWQTSLRVDYDVNDNLTLTSISSYSKLDYENGTEGGGTQLIELDIISDAADAKSFSQEIRLANDPSNQLRWLVGLNMEKSEVFQGTTLDYFNSTSTTINGFHANYYTSDQEMDNLAGFVNLEYDANDKATLKLGVRQTRAERDAVGSNEEAFAATIAPGYFRVTDFFNATWGFLGPAVFGQDIAPVPYGESFVLDTDPSSPGFATTGRPTGSLDEDSTSWSVGVDYKLTEDLLIYANIMKGFKAGSFPHVSGAIYDAYGTVDQEELLDYEAGFKASLADGRVSVNGAAFFYDYQDKQLRAKFIDPLFGSLDRLENVPESEIKGAELEVSAYLFDGLTVSAATTYLDTKVKQYEGVVGATVNPNTGLFEAVTAEFSGVELPHAPEWSYSARADYTFPISNSLNGIVGLGVVGQSATIGILTVDPSARDLYEIDDYLLVNMNIGVVSADEKWSLMLWGKNITDEYYWSNTILAFDTVGRYPNKPAEYGVTLSMNF